MKVYLPVEVHHDGHTELLVNTVYRTESEAKKQLYARSIDQLRQAWSEEVERVDKRYRNRVAAEKRALTLHLKKVLALTEAGFSKLAGKAPVVSSARLSDETVPEFDVWLEGRAYQMVVEMDLN